MNYKDALIKKISDLNQEIKYLEDLILRAPEGSLIARKSANGTFRYAQKIPKKNKKKKEVYLSSSNLDVAKNLALKDYAKHRIQDAKQEKYFLELELSYISKKRKAEHFLEVHPGAAQLVLPFIRKRSEQLILWKDMPYVRSQEYPEDLKFPTIVPDFMVRSKAEADILSRFEHFGVPYHYEEELKEGNTIIFPDFTCRNMQTGKFIYWEHQGKWDDPGYIQRVNKRNLIYSRLGISPGDNLIVTAETGSHPLDLQWVDQLIEYYLL